MNLYIKFSELERAVHRMGASFSTWRIGETEMTEPERLRKELFEGKEVPPSEVDTDHDGLLSYSGEQVLLYIKDTRQDKNTLLYDRENSRRFHFYNCSKLQEMRDQGRYDRYVVTQRDDGLFPVNSYEWETREHGELEAPLGPCRICLKTLNYKCYLSVSREQKEAIWEEFSIKDFFAEYSTFFVRKPKYTDKTAPSPGYARNWAEISRGYRESMGWRCEGENCGVDLSNHKSLLHVHHKNGVTGDNSNRNLEALCYLCHSEQPLHNHMKPNAQIRSTILRLRAEQGLNKSS